LDYFIGLNAFVNHIFQVVFSTLSAFTGEGFVVSSAEWIGGYHIPPVKAPDYFKRRLNDGLKNSLELM